MKYLFIIFLFAGMGCATTSQKDVSGVPLDGAARAAQEQQINFAIAEYEAGHFEKSLQMFQAFKTNYSGSPFFQAAQMGEAKSYTRLGKWSEAVAIFNQITDATRNTQPEIAAEALYQASFCYEALGIETRVYASLLDAQNMKKFLPAEIGLAEIPARLAASYYRMDRFDEAQKSLQSAEAGIQQLKIIKGKDLSEKYLAQIYYQMGSVSLNQLSLDNFESMLAAFKTLQIFSLKSVEYNVPQISNMALQNLKNNYRDLTELISQVPINHAANYAAAHREQVERKTQMATQILSALEKLRQNRMPGETEGAAASSELFSYLKDIETKLVGFLNSRGDFDELTPEASKLNDVKKNLLKNTDPVIENPRSK